MAKIVYLMCFMGSLVCVFFLLRGYLNTKTQLLLWSALCFCLLALNNVLLFVDLGLFPLMDIAGPFWRNLISASAGILLLFGLIWETK